MSRKDNPGLVTFAQCQANIKGLRGDISGLKGEIIVIKKALVGENLQGGLVKKLSVVEAKVEATQKAQSSVWNFSKAIIIAVLSAAVTAIALGAFPL